MDILQEQFKADISELALIKTEDEIEKMRITGQICVKIFETLSEYIKPGITTRKLDTITHDLIINKYGAEFDRTDLEGFDYNEDQCIFYNRNNIIGRGEVNDDPLKLGDIFGIDLSFRKNGYCGDTQKMWIVGDETSALARRLFAVAYQAMWIGINHVKPGVHLGTIAHAVESYVQAQGFQMVKVPGLTGHAIGKVHCEGLLIPFYGQPGTGHVLKKGMTITIEPFICAGTGEGVILPNAIRTAVTKDHSLAGYWEHVVAVTDTGCEVLDLRPGESDLPV